MSAEGRTNTAAGLLLLNLFAWVRRQGWLQRIYRRLPGSLRNRAARTLVERAQQRARFVRTSAWERPVEDVALPDATPAIDRNGRAGVNVYGYLRGQFGLAESARMYARALIDSGYPVALHDIEFELPHSFDDTSLSGRRGGGAGYANSLFFVNPDYFAAALEQVGAQRLQGQRRIACWFWELQEVPESWLPALELVDEIMVATSFVEQAFRRVTDKPIVRVALPLSPVPDSGLSRADFGLDPDRYVFLCTFDFNSLFHRKNPLAVVEAFRRAFPQSRDDVQLLLKTSNGHHHHDRFLELLNVIAGDSRILVRDEVIDRAHIQSLQRCADVYVSLHRSEGFGLGLAESMALGKPVIGTGWSGNLDFMTAENSCLVDYRLVPVGEGEYLHSPGAVWAEPDIDDAARYMRMLADDRVLAARMGARAAADIAKSLSPRSAADALISCFENVGQVSAVGASGAARESGQ